MSSNNDDLEFLTELEEKKCNLERAMQGQRDIWGHSTLGLEAKNIAMSMLATKHGMYTKIPINCKAESCPYREQCALLKYDIVPEGEPCPIETSQIELRYQGYREDFNLDEGSFTDKNIVSEIINLDIQIERCKALMANEGVPVVDVVAGVSEEGEPFFRPEVSKFADAYERFLERRNKLYQLMKATRADKKEVSGGEQGITEVITMIKAMDIEGAFVEDTKPAHLE